MIARVSGALGQLQINASHAKIKKSNIGFWISGSVLRSALKILLLLSAMIYRAALSNLNTAEV